MSAAERLLDALRDHGCTVTGTGRQHMASCPAHPDRNPSLAVTAGESRVLLKCHANCDTDDVLAAVGMTRADLFDEPMLSRQGPSVVAAYDYTDEQGQLLFQVVRTEPKGFRQRRPDGSGWAWRLGDTRRVLYRLPALVAAVEAAQPVYVVEGEKDADRLAALGVVATTNPGGAGKWRPEYGDVLAGVDVTIVADRDEPGLAHARQVAADLADKASSVRVVQAAAGKDVSDHLSGGHSLDELVPVAEDVETNDETTKADRADDFALDVDREAYRLRVREAARVKVAAESAPEVASFDADLLRDVLARPAEPQHRVDGLIAWRASALIVAMRKLGKTTFQLNLARCLITGEDFLGRFAVRPITGRVGFLNFEVSGGQLARWADDVGVPRDRLYLVNLRGRRNPFNNPEDRERLAERLREQEVESLFVDPFGRAYAGKSQNDSGEVGAWLADLDRFARGEVGVDDVTLAAHAGWEGERSRGASALEDWADTIVTITRSPDADDPSRFLKALGRDVEVEEDRLDFDPTTRLLTLTGAGSRKVVAKTRHLDELVPAVVDVVTATPGLTGYKLAGALRDAGEHFQRGDPVKAARVALDRGDLRIEDGPRNSKRYFPAHLSPPAPTYPDRDTSPPIPTSYIRGGVGGTGQVAAHLSQTLDPASQPVRDLAEEQEPAHLDTLTASRLVPNEGTPPTCWLCGQRLLYVIPGRDVCAKCEPLILRPSTTSRQEHA